MYRTTAISGYQPCFLKACVHDRGTVMTRTTSPFHAGEQTIQSLAGVRDRIELRGRAVIRDYMPEQHRTFFAALPFMVVGLADQNGHPWATTLSGPPGFMNSAKENLLTIKAWLDPGDPLHSCIRDGAPVGGLGIELSTRRRNRVNGRIENCIIGEGFSIRVQQSFGNCPKYIQARNEQPRPRSTPVPKSRMASDLGDDEVSFIAGADTFFIASRSAQLDQEYSSHGLDVSHRGGLPGFVRVVSRTELCFPDFSGNLLFNTLGNLEVDARAGLLFIDFESGRMLHVIGRTRISWDVPETTRSAGIERLIFLDIQSVVNRDHAFPHVFDFVSYSPHLGAER
jgi:predicted pyridoxine 5'-phosphate oxidase superfamily flavin-nucleotide-binding protein